MNKYSILWLLLLLFGCGGGDSASDSNSSSVSPDEEIVVSDQQPVAFKRFAFVNAEQEQFINLANYIAKGSKLENVASATNTSVCANSIGKISDLGFTVKIAGATSCYYKYTLISAEQTSALKSNALRSKLLHNSVRTISYGDLDNITVVSGLPLKPISEAIYKNQVTTINIHDRLNSDFPSGYELPEYSIALEGNGEIIAIDSKNYTIKYKAGTEEGISRITYSLNGIKDNGDQDLRVGVIDIAVSSGIYQAPTATAFDVSKLIVDDTSVAMTISVAEHVGIPESVDSDNSDISMLSLFSVSSLTGDVAINSDDALTFTFVPTTLTNVYTHIVSYTVTDGRGGFATAVVRVNVDDEIYARWGNRYYDGKLFVAPLTYQEAIELDVNSIVTINKINDSSYAPAIVMATFTAEEAQRYCELVYKARLPTSLELTELYNNDSPFNAADGYWPSTFGYFVKDEHIFKKLDPNTGQVLSVTEAERYYVTCVRPMADSYRINTTISYMNGFPVNDEGKVVAANGEDSAVVTVDVTSINAAGQESPMTTGIVTATLLNSSATGEIKINSTDEGSSSATQELSPTSTSVDFSVTNTKSGLTLVKIEYGTDGLFVLQPLKFVGDARTARIVTLDVVRDGQPAGDWKGIDTTGYAFYHLRNSIAITVMDKFNNPVSDMTVSVSGDENDKRDFFAYEDRKTDSLGRITDYPVSVSGLLTEGLRVETNTFIVTLNAPLIDEDRVKTVKLTNTLPIVSPKPGVLFTYPLIVDEKNQSSNPFTGNKDPQGRDEYTWKGIKFARLTSGYARSYCQGLDKHGYTDWDSLYSVPTKVYPLDAPYSLLCGVANNTNRLDKLINWPFPAYYNSFYNTNTSPPYSSRESFVYVKEKECNTGDITEGYNFYFLICARGPQSDY